MKPIILTISILTLTLRLAAQNLVPNPSFEIYKNLPCSWNTSSEEFSDYVNNWYCPAATSTDIHSTLADATCWANPLAGNEQGTCRLGKESPHTGNVMAGLYTSVASHVWHEYLGVKLTKPLVAGQRYYLQMWVSAGDYVAYASNNIGMLFTKEPVSGDDIIIAKPQFNWTEVITQKEGWVLLTGSFTATDDSQYLTIGNFFPDNETSLQPLNTEYCSDGAYYFIDDIAVYPAPA
jgi:hypothetical protein